MTNATPQKVCNLTLNSFSGTHRHTLGGRHGAIGGAYVIFMWSYTELGTPTVNHLRSVYVPWFSIWLHLRCWLCGNTRWH